MVLGDLEREMGSIDLTVCSAADLASLTQRVLAGQRITTGFVNQVMAESRRREEAGVGAPASELVRGGGAVSNEAAKQLDRRAGIGEALPKVGSGIDEGCTRTENADILAQHLERLTDQQRTALARFETEIARHAEHSPPETFTRWLSRLVRKLTEPDPEPGQTDAERQRAASQLWVKRGTDGMWNIAGKLDDQRGTELNDIITRVARRLDVNGEATANARIDALHRLVARKPRPAGAHVRGRATSDPGQRVRGRVTDTTDRRADRGDDSCADHDAVDWLDLFDPGAQMGVGYIVDVATLAEGPHDRSVAQTWGGHDIDPTEAACLGCDTDLYAILYNQLGQPTKVGRTRRAASREQRLLLRGLYDRCPLDGTPFADCDIHHVNLPWEDGGDTELDNLLPISRSWHRRVHHRGWRLKMNPDRSLKIWRPDGQLHRALPPPQPITRE